MNFCLAGLADWMEKTYRKSSRVIFDNKPEMALGGVWHVTGLLLIAHVHYPSHNHDAARSSFQAANVDFMVGTSRSPTVQCRLRRFNLLEG